MRIFAVLACFVAGTALAAAPEQSSPLLELAKKKFGAQNLRPSERTLFLSTEKGEQAVGDPTNSLVRAEYLSWLCTDREASARVTFRGVDIAKMKIEGNLDLDSAQIPFPILAKNCEFEGEISLVEARIRSIELKDCTAKAIDAEGITVEGMMFFQPNFQAGGVKLLDATIKGNFECDGAMLSNPDGFALEADGARIDGRVFLRGVKADGEVQFLDAVVGGNVECDGAQISAKETALNFDGANIKGSIFLRSKFTSHGKVNLLSAVVGGNVECDDAEMSATTAKTSAPPTALDFDDATVQGGVFLRSLTSHGEVNMWMAKIGGAFDCSNAHFSNPDAIALRGYKLHVERSISFTDGFLAEGEINLSEASVGGSFYCENSQFTSTTAESSDQAPTVSHSVLYLNGSRIDGSVYLEGDFSSRGVVSFGDVVIGGNLVIGYAQFNNPTGDAFYAENIKVEGNVYFRRDQSTMIDGRVNFFGASIANDFMWWSVQLSPTSVVDLRYAKVAMLEDNEQSWPQPGNLLIDGFVYDRIYEESSDSRQRWLALQPAATPHFQPYNQLAAIYRNLERSEDVRDVMIAKNVNYSKFTKRFSLDWMWYNVIGRLIGYGYDPLRPFLLSVFVIGVDAFIFHRARRKKIITATKDEISTRADPEAEKIPENYPTFNALIYSMESFIPLIKFDQASNWMPNTNRGKKFQLWRFSFTSGSICRGYLWLHIIAGWVLTSWWVGLVTGITKS